MSRVSDFLNGLAPITSPYICPDCTAEGGSAGPAVHDETCWVSAGVEAACDGDRDWFDNHPGQGMYHRRISAAELAEVRMAAAAQPLPTHVEVVRIAEGVRARRFLTVVPGGAR